jgi:hypothetical protein
MAGLRSSLDLQSLRTRSIIVQNQDGTFPARFSLLATDKKGRGVTEFIQDISVNSVTLFGNSTTGVLTYSDVSGLLLNSAPITSSPFTGLTSANAGVGIDISGTALNPLIGLLTPVPFDPVASTVSLPELTESYNKLLDVLNEKIIKNFPPPVSGLTVFSGTESALAQWDSLGPEYVYAIDLCGSIISNISENFYFISQLVTGALYSISVTGYKNPAYITPPEFTISFYTAFPITVVVGTVTATDALIAWSPAGDGYTYTLKILLGATVIQTHPGLTVLEYQVTGLSESTNYSASVTSVSGPLESVPYTADFTTVAGLTFGFSQFPGAGLYTISNSTPGLPYSTGYRVRQGSSWIGRQFNIIKIRLRADEPPPPQPPQPPIGPTRMQINVYNNNDINGQPVAFSGITAVGPLNTYFLALSQIVAIAYPMFIQFECLFPGGKNLDFELFRTENENDIERPPVPEMEPVIITNSDGIVISPFPEPGRGFICDFTLIL